MSGICAIWGRDYPGGAAAKVAAVSRGLSLVPEERVEYRGGRNAGVGVAALFATQQIYENDRVADCVRRGSGQRERTSVSRRYGTWQQPPSNAKTAALLAALYERFGSGFVEKLRGGFSVILWDIRERMLVAPPSIISRSSAWPGIRMSTGCW